VGVRAVASRLLACGAGLVAVAVLAACSVEKPDSLRVEPNSPEWGDVGRVPVGARTGARIAWDGRADVVFGGRPIGADGAPGETASFVDGARFDPLAGEWTPIQDAPFPHGLDSPAVVGTDRGFLVVGASCAGPSGDGAPVPRCEPDGYGAAFFDSQDYRWRRVELPRAITRSAVAPVRALGWSGTVAVLGIGDEIWTWSPPTEQWRRLPPPPFEARDACLAGADVVALAAADAVAAGVLTVAGDGEHWQRYPIEPPGIPGTARLACGATTALALDPAGADRVLDREGGRWRALVDPDPDPGAGALAVPVDDGLALLGDDTAVSYDEKLGRWVERRWRASKRPAAATTDGVNVYMLFEDDDGTVSMSAVRALD
jgi:hypothetical protein